MKKTTLLCLLAALLALPGVASADWGRPHSFLTGGSEPQGITVAPFGSHERPANIGTHGA